MKFLILTLMILFAFPSVAAELSRDDNCRLFYERSGVCPEDVCHVLCPQTSLTDKCTLTCVAKPCEQLSVENCPKDTCQIINGCAGTKVCYAKPQTEPSQCGVLAYFGDAQECCEGLEKRCGLEFFDGSCDMEGHNSIYSVPICIPCGNGICNQFENACNCPEDCLRDKKLLPVLLGEDG